VARFASIAASPSNALVIRRLLMIFLCGPRALDLLAYKPKVLRSLLLIRIMGLENEFYVGQPHTKPAGCRVELR
jgi:hypothetical protein